MCYARIENVDTGLVRRLYALSRYLLALKVEAWLRRRGDGADHGRRPHSYRIDYHPA